jgi:hypothetical protein
MHIQGLQKIQDRKLEPLMIQSFSSANFFRECILMIETKLGLVVYGGLAPIIQGDTTPVPTKMDVQKSLFETTVLQGDGIGSLGSAYAVKECVGSFSFTCRGVTFS